MESCKDLVWLCPQLSTMLKSSTDVLWPAMDWWSLMEECVCRHSLKIPQRFCLIPQCTLHHITTVPVYYLTPVWCCLCPLVLLGCSLEFYTPLKYVCMPYFVDIFVMLSHSHFVYGMTIWLLVLLSVSVWLLSVVLGLFCVKLSFCILLRVNTGYSLLMKPSHRYFSSVLSSCGVQEAALAFLIWYIKIYWIHCVSMLIKLIFHSYVIMTVPLQELIYMCGFSVQCGSAVMIVSRKGIEPSAICLQLWILWHGQRNWYDIGTSLYVPFPV